MYHPLAIAASTRTTEAALGLTLHRTPVAQARTNIEALVALWDPDKGALSRALTSDEATFIFHERFLAALDARYFLERYAMVNKGAQRLEPLAPLWVSQEIVLRALAEAERKQIEEGAQDGCFATVLKARQLGVSTLTEALLVHRFVTRPYSKLLIASDVSTSSAGLFAMAELLYRSLPWYLKPQSTKYVTSGEHRQIALDTDSLLEMQSGKAMRGQLTEESGESKGEIGRSHTFSGIHLSELATWEHPEQLDSALFPTIPIAPYTFGVLESTAKGRHNWWHQQWQLSERGLGSVHKFAPVFIPWYAEPNKWRLRPPAGWSPSAPTVAHATRCSESSHKWLGRTVTLTRDQLYWYEGARAAAEEKEDLAHFLAEYPADPEECFQHSGRSIFPLQLRERIKAQARPLAEMLLIEPAAMAQERATLMRDTAAGQP